MNNYWKSWQGGLDIAPTNGTHQQPRKYDASKFQVQWQLTRLFTRTQNKMRRRGACCPLTHMYPCSSSPPPVLTSVTAFVAAPFSRSFPAHVGRPMSATECSGVFPSCGARRRSDSPPPLSAYVCACPPAPARPSIYHNSSEVQPRATPQLGTHPSHFRAEEHKQQAPDEISRNTRVISLEHGILEGES